MVLLVVIFSHYKENFETLLDYVNIGGWDIKDYIKKIIRNLLHANSDVHSRRLVAEFPVDVVKFISKLQYHCAYIPFAEKGIYDRIFQQVTHKGG